MLRHLFREKKGQLAPIFIAILFILIMMAMVTVNISKVALIRTEASNAVDAGALAAGSVMANLFNAIGKANRQMEDDYWAFYKNISEHFLEGKQSAIVSLTDSYISAVSAKSEAQKAYEWACTDPCAALGKAKLAVQILENHVIPKLDTFISKIEKDILPAVEEYHEAQFRFYSQARETAEAGPKKAIQIGHKFAFMNSGIGSKLKDRSDFNRFLNEVIKDAAKYKYSWIDGQGREHSVEVKVQIAPVEKFELKVCQNTFPEEKQALQKILQEANQARENLQGAVGCYKNAIQYLYLACYGHPRFRMYYCSLAKTHLQAGINKNQAALDLMKPLFTSLPEAWKKLLPREEAVFLSQSKDDAKDELICWIEEIIHDRRVRVDTTQEHGEYQYGADSFPYPINWRAKYKETSSYSIVDFSGQGQIHRPVKNNQIQGPILRYNPSIIETDKIGNKEPTWW